MLVYTSVEPGKSSMISYEGWPGTSRQGTGWPWPGMGRQGMGRQDMGWPGTGRQGMGWPGMGWPGMCWRFKRGFTSSFPIRLYPRECPILHALYVHVIVPGHGDREEVSICQSGNVVDSHVTLSMRVRAWIPEHESSVQIAK